ncbi:MAG: hypothetical protein ACK5AZ_16900 [Bryobacteraceae bacterium]
MDSISLYEKRETLRRILRSRHFKRARKKSRFLEFVCEQSFVGKGDDLNEYLIGVEVYERGADFNTQDDAIVRVQAHEIRRCLREYYEDEGRDDPWKIEIPPGQYAPVFVKVSEGTPQPSAALTGGRERLGGLPTLAVVAGLAAACVILATLLVLKSRSTEAAPTVRMDEHMTWFWAPFLSNAESTLIVIPNHPLLRAAHEGDTPATLEESHLIPKEKLPSFRDTIHYRELAEFLFVPTVNDFTGIGETLGLLNLFEVFSRAGRSMRVKPSRLVDFEDVRRGNTILLGGNQSWSGRIFVYPQGFRFLAGVIHNKSPRPGERDMYKPEFDPVSNSLRRDYALVLMLPNEKPEHRILLIYGIYTQGSQAAIEYLTSASRLEELRQGLLAAAGGGGRAPKYFQALLETTVENQVPGPASLVAVRVIEGNTIR